jgi:hypothetical protein
MIDHKYKPACEIHIILLVYHQIQDGTIYENEKGYWLASNLSAKQNFSRYLRLKIWTIIKYEVLADLELESGNKVKFFNVEERFTIFKNLITDFLCRSWNERYYTSFQTKNYAFRQNHGKTILYLK